MAKVYIEARPKGRQEGTAIEDYVVEEQGDRVLKIFKTQAEAITWSKSEAALLIQSAIEPRSSTPRVRSNMRSAELNRLCRRSRTGDWRIVRWREIEPNAAAGCNRRSSSRS